MKILGIDPGTATTGWGIIEVGGGNIIPVAYGHISTSPKQTTAQRLYEVAHDLKIIIKKYKPVEAGIEDIFFFKNIKTVVKVSQSRGAMLLILQQKKIKISEYTPLQIKQALTGYGRAEKKQIQIMVKNILNLEKIPKPDDTADALAVAICHFNSRVLINKIKKNC